MVFYDEILEPRNNDEGRLITALLYGGRYGGHVAPFLRQTRSEWTDQHQEETALVAYEEAIALAPREASLYYRKGQILEQMGREEEAERAFDMARHLSYKKEKAS